MGEWIKCSDRLPREPEDGVLFDSIECLVSDGVEVGVCSFDRGHGCGTPWADWSFYGDLRKHTITHWQPLPEPPND